MKRITDKNQYNALMKVLISQDTSSKDSVMKTILINKMINYLFIKLPETSKIQMLEILKTGISKDFLDFMNANLDDKDVDQILQSANVEYTEIFNQALISQTNGE